MGAAMLVVLAAILACRSPGGSRSKLEYGSEDDVEKLLARGGAPVKVTDCENARYGDGGTGTGTRDNGVTRALSCFTTLTTAQSTALVSGLALHPSKPSTSSGPSLTGTCGARGFVIGASGFDAYEARGRPASAPGFEYVIVVVETATGRSCVQLEYAWS